MFKPTCLASSSSFRGCGKRPHNDGKTAKIPMLESSVLTGGIFTVVVVADNHSFSAVIAVVGADLGRDAESGERDERCGKQAYGQDLRRRGAGEDRDIDGGVLLARIAVLGKSQGSCFFGTLRGYTIPFHRRSGSLREIFWRCPRYLSHGLPALLGPVVHQLELLTVAA
ncbi:hypothetical protein EDD85DRAFT_844705, partial [Armillaria nabsnona]